MLLHRLTPCAALLATAVCGSLALSASAQVAGSKPVLHTHRAQNGGVQTERNVSYLGASHNIRLSNGSVELILTTDYGPRIMRYAFVGSGDDGNVFATLPDPDMDAHPEQFHIRGGHRIWHAPEKQPDTYLPDNGPVEVQIVQQDGDTVKLIEPTEKETGIQKELWVSLDGQSSRVTVTHRLTNRGTAPVNMACWGLSAMHAGGKAIFPQEPFVPHEQSLLPARPLVLWTYTNLTDPRFLLGKQFIVLQQTSNKDAQKIGLLNKQGWAAYHRKDLLFVKRFDFDGTKTYPDYNVNNETFTNDAFLELETLGPLQTVAPGESLVHVETWYLYRDVKAGRSEADITRAVLPHIITSAPAAHP